MTEGQCWWAGSGPRAGPGSVPRPKCVDVHGTSLRSATSDWVCPCWSPPPPPTVRSGGGAGAPGQATVCVRRRAYRHTWSQPRLPATQFVQRPPPSPRERGCMAGQAEDHRMNHEPYRLGEGPAAGARNAGRCPGAQGTACQPCGISDAPPLSTQAERRTYIEINNKGVRSRVCPDRQNWFNSHLTIGNKTTSRSLLPAPPPACPCVYASVRPTARPPIQPSGCLWAHTHTR